MILPFLLLISIPPCEPLMARLQTAKTFGEAASLLEAGKLNKEQLEFWSKAFRMPFANQAEFKFHLELLEEARMRMKERK